MIGLLLGLLYGLAFIGGSFLTYVWGRVWWLAKGEDGCTSQLCYIALGLTVGSFANILIFGYRTWVNLVFGPDPRILEDWGIGFIIVGLIGLSVSKVLLMWAYERSRHSAGWKFFVAFSAAWTIGAPMWLLSLETVK